MEVSNSPITFPNAIRLQVQLMRNQNLAFIRVMLIELIPWESARTRYGEEDHLKAEGEVASVNFVTKPRNITTKVFFFFSPIP